MTVNNFKIQVIRSDRKTIAVEITAEMNILIRSPKYLSNAYIHNFVIQKSDWIEQHLQLMKEKNERLQKAAAKKLSYDEVQNLAQSALEIIPKRAEFYATIIGVRFNKLTIRNQISLWGSCSSKGNLSFNCLLMLTPPEVIDYVIVHELCHRKHMNHSKNFWSEVERVLPNYKESKKWLKNNGNALLARI